MTVRKGTEERIIAAKPGQTLLETLRENQFNLEAPCSGRGACGKCRAQITNAQTKISEADKRHLKEAELADGWRLACTTIIEEGQEPEVTLADVQKMEIITAYEDPRPHVSIVSSGYDLTLCQKQKTLTNAGVGGFSDALRAEFPNKHISLSLLRSCAGFLNEGEPFYNVEQFYVLTGRDEIENIWPSAPARVACGVAVDIGTTTVAFEMVDLLTGERLATYASENPQRKYGTDVVSRIKNAGEGKLMDLRTCVVSNILQGLNELLSQAGVESDVIRRVSVSGNTTMLHLLLGVPCTSLGLFPFVPAFTGVQTLSFKEVFDSEAYDCPVTILPGISTYVGSDIAAGLLFCGGFNREKPSLLIDLGTNGEMALIDQKRVLCTSTAAGPAFEGGNISCGSAGVPGAVNSTTYQEGKFFAQTIGGVYPPIGICGSGVLDIGARLVQNELIDETGLLEDDYFDDGVPIAPEAGVFFTQKDVRELQLAKSAVRAGMEVLLKQAGLTCDGIEHVYLAGGFGFHVDLEHASSIGLIPEELREKVVVVGNSSLGGCVRVLLNSAAEAELLDMVQSAEEINLSTDKSFNDMFMEFMYF